VAVNSQGCIQLKFSASHKPFPCWRLWRRCLLLAITAAHAGQNGLTVRPELANFHFLAFPAFLLCRSRMELAILMGALYLTGYHTRGTR